MATPSGPLKKKVWTRSRQSKVAELCAKCRGALDSFIAVVIEEHIRTQVVDAEDAVSAKFAAEELIGIVHSYLT